MHPNRERGPPSGGLILKRIRGLASGVGLASEGIHAHKESKAAKNESLSRSTSETSTRQVDNYQPLPGPPPSYQQEQDSKADSTTCPNEKSGEAQQREIIDLKETSLEDEWNLDDAQDEAYHGSSEKASEYDSIFVAPFPSTETPPNQTETPEDAFIRTHPTLGSFNSSRSSVDCPSQSFYLSVDQKIAPVDSSERMRQSSRTVESIRPHGFHSLTRFRSPAQRIRGSMPSTWPALLHSLYHILSV